MLLLKCCTLENSAVATGLEKEFSFQSQRRAIPKNVQTFKQLISRASKIELKILQARLHQYVNQELPDVQAGFRKGRRIRDQIPNICWIIEKENSKNIYFCLIDYAKAFDCVDYNKLWKILKQMGIPDHLTCLLQKLCAGQATVRTGHGTMDWERSMPRMCSITQLFQFRIHHVKYWAGWFISWNQDCG